jgi:N-acetylmuramoyl-L-alanine amidase
LKTAKYRQRIAESLFEAIQQYRRSFKTIATIAAQ